MGARVVAAGRGVRIAAWTLLVVGAANAVLGLAGLTVASQEVGTVAALGLAGAGLATVAAGWLVRRGNRTALYVALAVFEALLVVRLLTLSGGGESAGWSLVVLLGLVGALVVATVQVRRGDRVGHQPP